MRQIACIHTVYSVIEPFTAQLREALGKEILIHTLYDDFLVSDPALHGGRFSGVNHQRLRLDMQAQALTGADLIVVSCSTLSPSVRLLRGEFNIPIVAIDDAMIAEAVRTGERIGLIATATSTVGPSSSALRAASEAGKTLDIRVVCNEEAIQALKAGNREKHDALVLEMAEGLKDRDVLVLAQASMAHMEEPVARQTGIKTLSSPRRCIEQVKKLLEAL